MPSVCHMTSVMGAIFHPARIERLMKVDREGRFSTKEDGEGGGLK